MTEETNQNPETAIKLESLGDPKSSRTLKIALGISLASLFAVGLLWLDSAKNNQNVDFITLSDIFL